MLVDSIPNKTCQTEDFVFLWFKNIIESWFLPRNDGVISVILIRLFARSLLRHAWQTAELD